MFTVIKLTILEQHIESGVYSTGFIQRALGTAYRVIIISLHESLSFQMEVAVCIAGAVLVLEFWL